MATQRYISTSFWDDAWVQDLDPLEKLFYIYLLTNPLTTIAGVYKITDRRVSFDCGFSNEVVTEMWSRFTRNEKAVRHGEWVIIPAWPKHQRYETRGKIRDGIDNILKTLPHDVINRMVSVGYEYDMEPYGYHRNYSDTDTDTDTDTDLTLQDAKAPAPAGGLSPLKDELANQYQDAFTSETPASAWANIGLERKKLNEIASRTRRLSSDTGIDPEDLAPKILEKFNTLRRTERASFWKTASFTPSSLAESNRWGAVVDALKREYAEPMEVIF